MNARILLVDPFGGAAGDMLLAATLDALAALEGEDAATAVLDALRAVPALERAEPRIESVRRGALAARSLRPGLPHEHAHRGLADVLAVIDTATHLDDRVRERAREAFRRLADVEARMHGTTPEAVHFHEVGALDAILDILGFFAAADALGVEVFRYTRLVLGHGRATSAHGDIPVPAPATLELLRDHPVALGEVGGERVTPTAAAILATVFEPVGPDETVIPRAVGYGAGTRGHDDALGGLLRVVVGERVARARERLVVRCTVDDMTPESVAHATRRLFDAGALEVFVTPVQMKKNRPGVEITVIADAACRDAVLDAMFVHTTTLGVRVAREERVELERRVETVDTPLGPARVKVAVLPDGSCRAKPEYESCRELAEASGRPLDAVREVVTRAWRDAREPS